MPRSAIRAVAGLLTVRSDSACCDGDLKAFLRSTNRNLVQDEQNDLLHHLHEKQLRHERFMRDVSVFSPTASNVGSYENINSEP